MRPSPLRALRRALGVFVLVSSGLFGFGMAAASAQTCITLVCLPSPTPTPLPTLDTGITSSTSSLLNSTSTTSGLLTITSSTSSLLNSTSTTSGLLSSTSSVGGLLGTTTTTSSSTSSDLLGGVISTGQSPGPQSCTLNLAGVCILPSSSACPAGSTDPSCIVPTLNPGCTSNCTPGGGGGGGSPLNSTGGGGGVGTSGARPTGTFSAFGGAGLGGGGTAAGGGAQAIPLGLSVPQVPAVEQLSPVSGLQFGHALILWPLFGLLDVLGLAAVYLVVRRFRVRTD